VSAPLLIAVVSGKGGVGKTMLSVAVANEMARGCRTLLIDLDFFNRGLTGLFATMVARSPCQRIEPPDDLVRTVDRDDWVISNVAENLFVLSYGDLDKATAGGLETIDVRQIASHLDGFIERACAVAGCAVAVLDCHGGPDNTSFGACLISRFTILVSEPDKITLYGTLNFLRTLEGLMPDRQPDIRLVFNKVIPAFSARFLFRFYRRFLARDFAGHDLLAIFPMEAHLTKAFERTPFLTTVYPTSQLAAKTRLVLCELLGEVAPDQLSPAISCPNRFSRLFHKYYMGRWPKVLDMDVVMRILAISAVAMFALPALAEMAISAQPSAMLAGVAALPEVRVGNERLNKVVIVYLLVWLCIAIALKWLRDVDIFLTYSLQNRSVVGAVIAGITLLGICLPWGFADAAIVRQWVRGMVPNDRVLAYGFTPIMVLPLGLFLMWYARRGVRNMWLDKRFLEGGLRLAFCAGVPAAGILLISLVP
jgi:cellulose biosynthesis protein BcsQ